MSMRNEHHQSITALRISARRRTRWPRFTGALVAGLLLCLLSRGAHAGTLENLTKLMDIYVGAWPTEFNVKAYAARVKNFNGNAGAALEYLASLSEQDADARNAVAAARSQIFRAAGKWAWNVSIGDFKITVGWSNDDSLQDVTYGQVIELSKTMSLNLQELQHSNAPNLKTVRELYATLLSQVLPIYFVKAANISTAISAMAGAFEPVPGFFDVACVQRDYPASKAANIPQDAAFRYDCGRGFLVRTRKEDGLPSLVLTQNPEADIPAQFTTPVTDYIAKVYN
jgi:hypothetical protein